MGGKVGENPAALRAAVFSLASKNLRGAFKRSPPAGRGLRTFCVYHELCENLMALCRCTYFSFHMSSCLVRYTANRYALHTACVPVELCTVQYLPSSNI